MKKGLFILFTAALLYSCKKNTPAPAPAEGPHSNLSAGAVLFESVFVNYAWGYSHFECLIDTNGVVYLHTSTNYHEDWKFPVAVDTANYYMAADDLQHDCNFVDSVGLLNTGEVQGMHALVRGVNINDLSPLANTGNDMGGNGRYAYVWDDSAQKYHLLFLNEYGDVSQTNNNANAITINNWLDNKFEHEIGDFIAHYH